MTTVKSRKHRAPVAFAKEWLDVVVEARRHVRSRHAFSFMYMDPGTEDSRARRNGLKGAGVFDSHNKEVRVMRNAEVILGVIRDRGSRGLPLERVYRLLFSRELFLLAYGRIAKNRGASCGSRSSRSLLKIRTTRSSDACATSGTRTTSS